jgi:hypothetical protein
MKLSGFAPVRLVEELMKLFVPTPVLVCFFGLVAAVHGQDRLGGVIGVNRANMRFCCRCATASFFIDERHCSIPSCTAILRCWMRQ